MTLALFFVLAFMTKIHAQRPNVVIILTDDAGYADFGCVGGELQTSNIDKLADSGVKCTNAYTSGSCCSPTRAGLITGRYQNRFGHEFNLPKKPRVGDAAETLGMSVDEMTIADPMKSAGYRTGIVGKWHLGLRPEGVSPHETRV
jgi:arylsulfatase A-like enzyme